MVPDDSKTKLTHRELVEQFSSHTHYLPETWVGNENKYKVITPRFFELFSILILLFLIFFFFSFFLSFILPTSSSSSSSQFPRWKMKCLIYFLLKQLYLATNCSVSSSLPWFYAFLYRIASPLYWNSSPSTLFISRVLGMCAITAVSTLTPTGMLNSGRLLSGNLKRKTSIH